MSWCAWPSPSENNVYEAEKRGRRRRNKRWLPWILRNSASVYLARGAQLSFFLSRPPCLHLSFTDYAISRICFRVLDKLNDGGETRKINIFLYYFIKITVLYKVSKTDRSATWRKCQNRYELRFYRCSSRGG